MVHDRQSAFNKISYVLAITRLDIQHHQDISDYSLNIHSENYWRDVFNFVYDAKYKNANFYTDNAPCIDLVDSTSKSAVQITTTRTKEKIDKTLKILTDEDFKGYSVKIYYLIDKAKPEKSTKTYIKGKYGVDLDDVVFDASDFVKDINDLSTPKLVELCNIFFSPYEKKYTDIKVLDLTIRDLVERHSEIKPSFDEDYQSLEVEDKIKLNKLNGKVSSKIIECLDYTCLIDEVADGSVKDGLQSLVVNDFYKKILIRNLSRSYSRKHLQSRSVEELTMMSSEDGLSFNRILVDLFELLESKVLIRDFNSTSVSWIIISYFFEYCEAGVKNALAK